MKAFYRYLLLPLLLICFSSVGQAQKSIPDDFCISDAEYHLYEIINAHRIANGLKEIPLSASLSYVARTHVIDLYTNHPDTSVCNMNSWSDKGDWTACCHNKYFPKESCVRDKPKELTSYTGEGYELTYAEIMDINPDTVFSFWEKIETANQFLINQGPWEKKLWKAMGVGIYKSYAVLWMGQKTDPAPKPVLCSVLTEKKVQNVRPDAKVAGALGIISQTTGRFYIIVASFQSEADAQREANKVAKVEGQKVSIIKNNQGQYRVSVNDYPNLDEAKQGKEEYSKSFKGAWILNF